MFYQTRVGGKLYTRRRCSDCISFADSIRYHAQTEGKVKRRRTVRPDKETLNRHARLKRKVKRKDFLAAHGYSLVWHGHLVDIYWNDTLLRRNLKGIRGVMACTIQHQKRIKKGITE